MKAWEWLVYEHQAPGLKLGQMLFSLYLALPFFSRTLVISTCSETFISKEKPLQRSSGMWLGMWIHVRKLGRVYFQWLRVWCMQDLFFVSAFPIISNAVVIEVFDMCNYSDFKIFSICCLDNSHSVVRSSWPISILHDLVSRILLGEMLLLQNIKPSRIVLNKVKVKSPLPSFLLLSISILNQEVPCYRPA